MLSLESFLIAIRYRLIRSLKVITVTFWPLLNTILTWYFAENTANRAKILVRFFECDGFVVVTFGTIPEYGSFKLAFKSYTNNIAFDGNIIMSLPVAEIIQPESPRDVLRKELIEAAKAQYVAIFNEPVKSLEALEVQMKIKCLSYVNVAAKPQLITLCILYKLALSLSRDTPSDKSDMAPDKRIAELVGRSYYSIKSQSLSAFWDTAATPIKELLERYLSLMGGEAEYLKWEAEHIAQAATPKYSYFNILYVPRDQERMAGLLHSDLNKFLWPFTIDPEQYLSCAMHVKVFANKQSIDTEFGSVDLPHFVICCTFERELDAKSLYRACQVFAITQKAVMLKIQESLQSQDPSYNTGTLQLLGDSRRVLLSADYWQLIGMSIRPENLPTHFGLLLQTQERVFRESDTYSIQVHEFIARAYLKYNKIKIFLPPHLLPIISKTLIDAFLFESRQPREMPSLPEEFASQLAPSYLKANASASGCATSFSILAQARSNWMNETEVKATLEEIIPNIQANWQNKIFECTDGESLKCILRIAIQEMYSHYQRTTSTPAECPLQHENPYQAFTVGQLTQMLHMVESQYLQPSVAVGRDENPGAPTCGFSAR